LEHPSLLHTQWDSLPPKVSSSQGSCDSASFGRLSCRSQPTMQMLSSSGAATRNVSLTTGSFSSTVCGQLGSMFGSSPSPSPGSPSPDSPSPSPGSPSPGSPSPGSPSPGSPSPSPSPGSPSPVPLSSARQRSGSSQSSKAGLSRVQPTSTSIGVQASKVSRRICALASTIPRCSPQRLEDPNLATRAGSAEGRNRAALLANAVERADRERVGVTLVDRVLAAIDLAPQRLVVAGKHRVAVEARVHAGQV